MSATPSLPLVPVSEPHTTVRATQYRRGVKIIDQLLLALPPVRFEPEAVLRTSASPAALGREEVDGAVNALCEDLQSHPPSSLGARVAWATLTRARRNRVKIREAADPVVRAPIIIVGWHRSGTTWLHKMLGDLPGCRQLPLYALMDPIPSPFRRVAAEVVVRLGQISAPEMDTIHPFQADQSEECWTLMLSTYHVEDLTIIWSVPEYTRYMDRADLVPAYRHYRKSVGVLAEQFPGTTVLKGPGHLAHLSALARAYPEARFIWTHRDPGRMVTSYASLAAVQHRTIYGRYDPATIGARVVDRAAHAVHRGMASLADIDPARIAHVSYTELTRDPIATVRGICDQFGLEFDEKAVGVKAAEKAGAHHYTAAQWGLDEAAIRERFAEYRSRFAM